MKMVIAVVQPFMAARVVDALHGVEGLSGATFVEVRGFGRGRGKTTGPASEEDLLDTLPKVRVEVVLRDDLVDAVVKTIQAAAHTGRRGDGKIFVLPAETAVRISTGEQGDQAV